jgi:hypothetical protein
MKKVTPRTPQILGTITKNKTAPNLCVHDVKEITTRSNLSDRPYNLKVAQRRHVCKNKACYRKRVKPSNTISPDITTYAGVQKTQHVLTLVYVVYVAILQVNQDSKNAK